MYPTNVRGVEEYPACRRGGQLSRCLGGGLDGLTHGDRNAKRRFVQGFLPPEHSWPAENAPLSPGRGLEGAAAPRRHRTPTIVPTASTLRPLSETLNSFILALDDG